MGGGGGAGGAGLALWEGCGDSEPSLETGWDPSVPAAHPALTGLGLWAGGPSRRLGDRRGGSVCAARVRVRVGPPRHARLRPPWGGVSRTGYGDPSGPADVTPAPLGRRMTCGDGGAAMPSSSARDSGDSVPATEKDRASQAHVQSERHSGLTLEARGVKPGGVNCETVRAAGPSVDTIPTHVAFAWGPDLTTPAAAWSGPCPSWGVAGDYPVGCRGQSADRNRSPPRSPRAAGAPPAGGHRSAGRLKPAVAEASHSRAAGNPLLSLPLSLVAGVARGCAFQSCFTRAGDQPGQWLVG